MKNQDVYRFKSRAGISSSRSSCARKSGYVSKNHWEIPLAARPCFPKLACCDEGKQEDGGKRVRSRSSSSQFTHWRLEPVEKKQGDRWESGPGLILRGLAQHRLSTKYELSEISTALEGAEEKEHVGDFK